MQLFYVDIISKNTRLNDEEPYLCKICMESFRQIGIFRRHSKDNPLKNEICIFLDYAKYIVKYLQLYKQASFLFLKYQNYIDVLPCFDSKHFLTWLFSAKPRTSVLQQMATKNVSNFVQVKRQFHEIFSTSLQKSVSNFVQVKRKFHEIFPLLA